MVEFAGWEMPLHYGSQIEEHHRVRRDAGMFDVSHMRVLDLQGTMALEYLRRLAANNVDKLAARGQALYSCMLNHEGGVIDDLILYCVDDSWFRVVANAATADKDLAWMQAQRDALATAVEITPRSDLAIIAVQGPNARSKLWQALPAAQPVTETMKPFQARQLGQYFIARTGYTGEDGFEILLPAGDAQALWQSLLAAGASPAGLGARDTLRLEAGLNLYGQDMDETVSPLESGLAWTVDLKSPREFIGKAALLASTVKRNLAGLMLLEKGVLRSHQTVLTPYGKGIITSGGFSPTLNRSIGLARLPSQVAAGDIVEVEIRDKILRAKVVKYPFVRNGKILV